MHLVASVCPSVSLFAISQLNRLTYIFIFCMEVNLDLGYFVYVGQGPRSRSNAKNCVFTWLLLCFKVKVKGWGHGSRSRLNFWRAVVDTRGYRSHYQSRVFVCVSVISGRVRIIAQMLFFFFDFDLSSLTGFDLDLLGRLICTPLIDTFVKMIEQANCAGFGYRCKNHYPWPWYNGLHFYFR